MRVAYRKDDENSRPNLPRYQAILGFRDEWTNRATTVATIRRGAVGGAMVWIVSWNPRFAISRALDSFARDTLRAAKAELEAALFIEIIGYREGDGVLSEPVS